VQRKSACEFISDPWLNQRAGSRLVKAVRKLEELTGATFDVD
jgi:hypothetical protein